LFNIFKFRRINCFCWL